MILVLECVFFIQVNWYSVRKILVCVIIYKLYIFSLVIYSNNLILVFKFEVKKKKLFFNFFVEYMYYGKFNVRYVGSDFN